MRKKDVQTPMVVTISVFNGHHSEAFVDQVSLASWVVERWYMAPGVRRIPVTEQQLTGTLFLPPGTSRETTEISRAHQALSQPHPVFCSIAFNMQ